MTRRRWPSGSRTPSGWFDAGWRATASRRRGPGWPSQSAAAQCAVNQARARREALVERLRGEGSSRGRPRARRSACTSRAGGALHRRIPRGMVRRGRGVAAGVEELAAQPGQRVLDVCAAPGGKTVALAAGAAPGGLVVAWDVRPRRVRLLRQTLARTGARHVRGDRRCRRSPALVTARFDLVFVDAPCSGLHPPARPDIRWSRQRTTFPPGRRASGAPPSCLPSRAPGRHAGLRPAQESPTRTSRWSSLLATVRLRPDREHRTTPPADGLRPSAATLTRKLR